MLLVEALLEDHGMQWNDDGTPRDDTSKEMLSLTNAVLARNPSHLMANHLCIHLYDAAPDRGPATACATRLDAMTFAPQDEHLAHMPAHTWLERGDWRAAVASSERAYQLVATWAKASGQDITAAKYLRHDEYLGLSAAVLGGDLTAASQWSSRLNAFVPNGYDGAAGPHLTLAKGLASLRNGDRASAQADLDALRKAGLTEDVALLEARIDERDGKIDGALSALHRAQDWQRANLAPETLPLFPADERIGALQFRAGRYADAEATFRAVAKERPLAPRALYGLWQTLLERGNNEEAAAFADRFRTAWAGQYPLTMDDF
jgi:tetratricopeptide (TPR) repeat protein